MKLAGSLVALQTKYFSGILQHSCNTTLSFNAIPLLSSGENKQTRGKIYILMVVDEAQLGSVQIAQGPTIPSTVCYTIQV